MFIFTQQLDPAIDLTVNSSPDCWSGDSKSAASKCTAANMWNRQLTTPGSSYFRHRHTVVDEISWSPALKTTMDHHGELVLQPLRNSHSASAGHHAATLDATTAWTSVLTVSTSNDRWTRLSWRSLKKHVLQTFNTCVSKQVWCNRHTKKSSTIALCYHKAVIQDCDVLTSCWSTVNHDEPLFIRKSRICYISLRYI